MSANSRRVPSPCVNICVLDEQEVCTGCFRTIDEITTWSMLNPEQRERLQEVLAQRRRESGGA